jgi:3-hydroxyacyl-CoA dehydrogenase
LYLFFATSRTSKLPELAGAEPRPVERAAVIGMGTMGTGIAHALIQSGVPVVALDEDPSALQRAETRIETSLAKRVEQGKWSKERCAEIAGLLATTSDWSDIAGVDIVIESVFEQLDTKRTALLRAEQLGSDQTILATNTSTLSLDQLADGLSRPRNLVGMHFFNPAQRMPLLEIIRRDCTPPGVLAKATALAKRLRKTPVVVRNREGFLVNRLFVPYLQEAFFLLEEGAAAAEIDAAAVQFGFPMGPLVLIDMAGIDILVDSQRVLGRAFPHHGPLSPVVIRLVEQGHLGQKTGSGVYRYQPGERTPLDHEVTAQIVADVGRQKGCAARTIDPAEITERLVLRMVNEAFCVLQEDVARCESDVDVATVLGIGFPDFRGGVMKYARDTGLDEVRTRLNELSRRLGERFSPT